MKKVLAASVATALLMAGSSSMAADAGCGLGSIIFTKNSKLIQLFAATTNTSTLTQPLGITFGTSGCSASGLVMNDKQIQYFVEINQEELSREMAQGHGEKLATLALLKGCSSQDSQKAFAGFTQSSYSQILPAANTSAVDMVHNLNAEMAGQAELNQMCHGS
ncbi:MAG: DUF3015 family protein [Bdellovibrionales bacterium]|nr:DUF3015 family protein [Bdellovibrionales bacterium]